MVKKKIFKKNLGFISKTLFFCNIIAVLFLLMSYAASFINPKTFWPLAFFGLGYLPILIVNIGFVIYWILRKPRYALFTLLPILLGWNLLTKHWNFRSPSENKPLKDSSDIRVMSFNAHLFQTLDKGSNDDFKAQTLAVIDEVKPDIVCFQEFYTKIKGSKKFSEKILLGSEFQDYYFEPATKNKHEGYGQAIFSKYPIVNSGTIKKNEFGINRIIYADILKDGDTIRIYNVHLRSFALQNEDKEFIQKPSGNAQQDEAATRRVSRKLKDAFTQRSNQAASLRQQMEETPYPLIVTGDFNDTPMSYSVNLVGKGLKNAFQEKGSGWGVTHYEMLPLFQIDYILCSKQFAVKNYHVVERKLSDHYPIWADISLLN